LEDGEHCLRIVSGSKAGGRWLQKSTVDEGPDLEDSWTFERDLDPRVRESDCYESGSIKFACGFGSVGVGVAPIFAPIQDQRPGNISAILSSTFLGRTSEVVGYNIKGGRPHIARVNSGIEFDFGQLRGPKRVVVETCYEDESIHALDV